jgi:hypothetical protein
MLSKEFLIEKVVHKVVVGGNINVAVDDHFVERSTERKVPMKVSGGMLFKLTTVRDQLAEIEPGQQIWFYDTSCDVSLGIRKMMDTPKGMNLTLKTVWKGLTSSDIHPIIKV